MPVLVNFFPIYAQPIKFPINVPTIPYHHLNSTYEGTTGNDFAIGSDAVDIMYGNGGLDYIAGGGGSDKLYAGSNNGTYTVDGKHGTWTPSNSTMLSGDGGHDTLSVLAGAKGAFYLDGGTGNDTLVANGGTEVRMHGGAGDTDTFRIGANFKGHAFIDDFNFQAGDTLDLAHGTGSIASIWMNAGNTEINLTSGGHVTVQGFDFTQHNANWGGHLI